MVQELYTEGAVLVGDSTGAAHRLVGYMELVEPGHLFWCAAFGNPERDAAVIRFDAATFGSAKTITLFERGTLVAVISSIEQAELDDREDYRVAWSLWQEAAPICHAEIIRAESLHHETLSDAHRLPR